MREMIIAWITLVAFITNLWAGISTGSRLSFFLAGFCLGFGLMAFVIELPKFN